MNLFYQPRIEQGVFHLDEDESRHCVKVLRKGVGDQIDLTDGSGYFYRGVISKADARQCTFEIATKEKAPEKRFYIHVAIAPTKSADRMEWFVEKAVEIGIDRITLMECKNSERTYLRTDRLTKVAIGAMKQSLKATLPPIEGLIPFNDVITQSEGERFIAHVDSTNTVLLKDVAKPERHYTVMIGPEGDFTTEEISHATQKGFVKVSLGNSRLRTETAGLAACHILNLVND